MLIFALNELSSITVGSIIGQGDIESNILNQGLTSSIYSNWDFGIGFFIYIIAISIILLNLIYYLKSDHGGEIKWRIKRKRLNQK